MSDVAGGPYVQAALFCERVLSEKDNVLSLIRIIDRLVLTIAGPAAPEQMPPSPVACQAVIMLKTGSLSGSYLLKLTPKTPLGNELPSISTRILLAGGEDGGTNLIFNVQFIANEEGVYWFDVTFENQLLTRLPLRIVYQTLSAGQLPGTT
jgi:hypothetical protein